jgi:large conductance mechanosensitive channel
MDQTSSKGLVAEFKEFIATGNLLQVAVAFVLGGATAALITSFVKNIFNGIISAILGSKSGAGLSGRFNIADGNIKIGTFLDDFITFLILALVIFLLVKVANRFLKTQMKAAVPPEISLLTEIRDTLQKGR